MRNEQQIKSLIKEAVREENNAHIELLRRQRSIRNQRYMYCIGVGTFLGFIVLGVLILSIVISIILFGETTFISGFIAAVIITIVVVLAHQNIKEDYKLFF